MSRLTDVVDCFLLWLGSTLLYHVISNIRMAGPSIKHIPFVSHTSKVVACATAKFPAFSTLGASVGTEPCGQLWTKVWLLPLPLWNHSRSGKWCRGRAHMICWTQKSTRPWDLESDAGDVGTGNVLFASLQDQADKTYLLRISGLINVNLFASPPIANMTKLMLPCPTYYVRGLLVMLPRPSNTAEITCNYTPRNTDDLNWYDTLVKLIKICFLTLIILEAFRQRQVMAYFQVEKKQKNNEKKEEEKTFKKGRGSTFMSFYKHV